MKTTIELDFVKGETMICLVEGKFVQTTFTGNASACLTNGGDNVYISYETDLKDREHPVLNQRVDGLCCFHSVEEAMERTGLSGIANSLKEQAD